MRLRNLATNTTSAENHGLSQPRFSNEVEQPVIVADGGGGGWPRLCDHTATTKSVEAWPHAYQHCTWLFRFAFPAQASCREEDRPCRANTLGAIEKENSSKDNRRIINKEWEVNESTWSMGYFFGLFRNCRRRQQLWDGPRGSRSSLLWRALQESRFACQALILFHASWTKWRVCKNRKHVQKRRCMLACDPLVTQIRYGGENTSDEKIIWNSNTKSRTSRFPKRKQNIEYSKIVRKRWRWIDPFVHAQVAPAITNFRHSGDNTVDFLHLLTLTHLLMA